MVHHFEPAHYHTTMGSHEPALRVKDGDTVVTSTVDARGKDRTDKPVTPPGNPQTGPFHVEGAEPGDTLAVHLDRLTPNRPFGWTRPLVAPNVLDPDYVRETAGEIESRDDLCRW
ncbi:MAG: acetamidase/formamidase family protein, partial [Gemmatimonadota bacterium]|nr:acetamidase/formamidase family protein [Gemmatimonadota bacterium]